MSELTTHGDKRIRKRLGIPRKAAQSHSDRARKEGFPRTHFTGRLRRYLDKLWHEGGKTHDYRIFNGAVYVFAGETLITVWVLPQSLKKAATQKGGE